MPKLFLASGIFHPEPGGPATYLKSTLPALQELGWELRVLTYGNDYAVRYPYPVTRIKRQQLPLRYSRYAVAARAHIAWADLIYAQTIDLPLWGAHKRPRVIKIVGDQAWERCVRKGWIPPEISIDEFQAFAGNARVRWQKRARTRQIRAMDAVIVPSRYLQRLVRSWGIEPAKIRVIHNALSPPLSPRRSQADLRAELGWPDRPTLITVARLQPWKGIDHLIAALGDLAEMRLIVVGDGPDRSRLEALARPLGDRVVFTGHLAAHAAHRLMAAADGLALYSGYEGLSHTLLESLHLGTPVLASDKGGNSEIINHGVNGVLVPHVDVRALRSGIEQLMERREEFAANCSSGMERFSFQKMVGETDALLRSLL